MILYIAIFLVTFIIALLDLTKVTQLKKGLFFLVTFAFIIISGLRWRTGGDWGPYLLYFEIFEWGTPFSMFAFEPGFVLLTYINKVIAGGSYTIQLLSIATIAITARVVFFKRHTQSILFALFLFWGSNMAEIFGTRQSMAISICLLGYPLIEKKKFVKLLVLVIIAMQFHVTAFIYLVAYPVYHSRWNTKFKIALLLLSILVGTTGILNFILDSVASLGVGRLGEKAGDYAELDVSDTSGTNRSVAITVGILKRSVIFPILFYFENKIVAIQERVKFQKVMNLFVFGNVLYFLVINYLPMHRIAGYFYPFEILLMCLIIDNLSGYKKTIWFLVFSAYALLKFLFIIDGSLAYVDPYYWIFSETFDRAPIFY